jgi:hypothetical protein
VGLGIALIVAGSLLGLGVALVAWRRLPSVVCLVAIGACAAIAGAGALLVQDPDLVSPGDWVLTLVALAVMGPLQTSYALGRPGPR